MTDARAALAAIERRFADHRPSLRLPTGWFGRPYDNQHRLTWSAVRGNTLLVELDGLQELILMDVGRIEVTDDSLVLSDVGYVVLCRRDYADGTPSIIDCGSGEVSFVGGGES